MPPLDLSAQFNKLVAMISNDMKQVGENIRQIVAKITQLDQRLAALEKRPAMGALNPGQHGTTKVVNGQVVAGPSVQPGVPDATPIWNGDPNAFYTGAEDD
jgi:hypothetical protein